MLGDGGGSRTRTYEGLASGFTVRPLCRSGHSPIVSQRDGGRDEAADAAAYAAPAAQCQP